MSENVQEKIKRIEDHMRELQEEVDSGRNLLAFMAKNGVEFGENTIHVPIEDLNNFDSSEYLTYTSIDKENNELLIKVEKREETNHGEEKEDE